MAMRSVWKGVIKFSLITIPVKVFNAIEASEQIKFNQLHEEDFGPIGYDKRCKKCGKVVTNEEITKGFQHEPDKYIILDPEQIKTITPASSQAIEITGFIKPDEIPSAYFATSYFATPENAVAQDSYRLLREVMRRTGRIAIAKVILREHEDLIAISPNGNGLLIQKLHYRHEVRAFESMPGAIKEDTAVDSNQIDIAAQLVESMATSFDQLDTEDHFHTALKTMINARIAGEEITAAAPAPKQDNVLDIMDALKRSLAAKAAESAAPQITAAHSTVETTAAVESDDVGEQVQQPLLSLVEPKTKRPKKKAA